MNDIGIVIVTYNSGDEIGACLDAAAANGNAEVVVVDNASSDQTIAEVQRRGVRLIRNVENRGFAAAVNQGFRALSANYVVLLNPDAALSTSLDDLRLHCDLPGVAAAGGRTVGLDHKLQAGWMARRLPTPAALCFEVLGMNRLFPSNPVNWSFRCYDLDLTKMTPVEIEQPAGAFVMVRRDAWQLVGGFDESFYPLWFEDVDFCRRLKLAGLRVFHVPTAVAFHLGAHSIRKLPLGLRELYWYGSLLRYASKHFTPFKRRLVCCSVVAGSVIRAVCKFSHRKGWNESLIYWKIIGVASGYFISRQPGPESFS
jgi:N-acetylglucosaminyl-diphospho-decaprenol L-rhamnosyltransferase